MADLSPAKQRRIEALTAKFEQASRTNRENLLALITRFFDAMANPFAGDQAKKYVDQVVAATQRGQRIQAALASAFITRALIEMGLSTKPIRVVLPDQPRGVDPALVAGRALRNYRIAVSAGKSPEDARQAGLDQALVSADSDLGLAEREAYSQTLDRAGDGVTGYRRVIHPEISRGGVCGMCVAASDRSYHFKAQAEFKTERKDVAQGSNGLSGSGRRVPLLAIHDRCHCTILPVIGELDPGSQINAADLKQLYGLAGSTYRKDLSKVRYKIDDHGELGPYLRAASPGADESLHEIVDHS